MLVSPILKSTVLALFIFLIQSQSLLATHSAGGSLSYEHIGGNQYRFYMKYYRYCAGANEPSQFTLCIKNVCNNSSTSISLPKLVGNLPNGKANGSVTVDDCTGLPASCTSGYREWWYTAVYTLPAQTGTCDEWNFSVNYCCRNASDNLTGNTSNYFYVDASLKRLNNNTTTLLNNNSADFPNAPYPYYCINQLNTLNNQVFDADGDSLVFYAVNPTEAFSCNSTPVTIPYSNAQFNVVNNPFPTDTNSPLLAPTGTFALDSNSGGISFVPTQVGTFTISLRVDEYRNSQFIGHVLRDVQIQVISSCTQLPGVNIDSTSLINTTLTDSGIHVCAGQLASYCYYAYGGSDTAQISLWSNASTIIPNATVTQNYVSATGNDSIQFCINWSPSLSDTGVYYMLLAVQDSICEPPIYIYNQTYTLPIFVHAPPIINAVTSVPDCNLTNGSINLSTSIKADTFLLQPGNLSNTSGIFNNLSSGVYTVTLKNNFCSTTDIITLLSANTLFITNASVAAPNCINTNTGNIQITTQGGNGALTYSINPAISTNPNNGSFPNLNTGTYTVQVADNIGCVADTVLTINSPVPPSVNAVVTNTTTCYGLSDGSVAIQAISTSLPLTYITNPGNLSNNTGSFNNLGPGSYTTNITDINGCDTSINFVITEPAPLQLNIASTTPPSCVPNNNGVIIANYNGGTAPYTFSVNGINQASDTAINLSSGNQFVLVIDANGCKDSVSVILAPPTAPVISAVTVTDVLCKNDSNGSIQVNASGVNTPLVYSLNPIVLLNATGNFISLPANTYNIVVTDALNCSVSTNAIIIEPDSLTSNNLLSNAISCFGLSDGSIQLSMQGGTPNYNYQLNPNNIFNTSGNFTNLSEGQYNIIVSDQNNCIYTDSIVISQPDELNIDSIVVTNVLCYGDFTGNAIIFSQGGTLPYNFNLAPNNISSATGLFQNLNANNYSILLSDSNNCTDTASFIISEPLPIIGTNATTKVSCNASDDGTIQLSASGGQGPYMYSLLGTIMLNTSGYFDSLAAQNYIGIIQDALGCIDTISPIIIIEPDPLLLSANVTNEKCFGDSNGIIQAFSVGGNGGHSFNLTPGLGSNSNGLFTNLSANSYTLIITDSLQCSDTVFTQVASNPPQIFDSIVISRPLCFGDANGGINIFANGGKPSYLYSINNSAFNGVKNRTNLSSGQYNIIVQDSENCTLDTIIELNDPSLITIASLSNPFDSCFNPTSGEINVSAQGGSGILNYYLVQNSETNTTGYFNNLEYERLYQLVITDENNCRLDSLFILEPPTDTLKVNFNVVHIACNDGPLLGSAEAVPEGGKSPYTYFWHNNTNGTSSTINDLAYGIYTLTVTDSRGCAITDTVHINPGPCCNIFLPNAFTPNNDGLNDDFGLVTPAGLDINSFKVYNRWGECVWNGVNQKSRWDGTLRGVDCDLGTYFYIIKFKCLYDGKEYDEQGDLTLIR